MDHDDDKGCRNYGSLSFMYSLTFFGRWNVNQRLTYAFYRTKEAHSLSNYWCTSRGRGRYDDFA